MFDIPPAPDSPTATQAEQAHQGQNGKRPLPSKMMEPEQLRPATTKCRKEMSKGLVQRMYSTVWDEDAPNPSPFRHATVLLTPSYNNKGYMLDLGLTVADKKYLPDSKKHWVPTLKAEAEAKRESRCRAINAQALQAARKKTSRAAL